MSHRVWWVLAVVQLFLAVGFAIDGNWSWALIAFCFTVTNAHIALLLIENAELRHDLARTG